MRIKFGYELIYEFPQPTLMVLALNIHFPRVSDLVMTFCRCLNIPARYCTEYLGDIGVPPAPDSMDFSTCEACQDGRWYVFEPRHQIPRIGRILIAQGRDAADVPISNTFAPNQLKSFRVWTDEV